METGQSGSEQPKENRKFYFAMSYEFGEVGSDGHGYHIVVTSDQQNQCIALASKVLEVVDNATSALEKSGDAKVSRREKSTKVSIL